MVSHLQQKYHCIHKMPSMVLGVWDKKVHKTWFQSLIYILIGCTDTYTSDYYKVLQSNNDIVDMCKMVQNDKGMIN